MNRLYKHIITLILILSFVITGFTADLFGTYDQRIKLTIDHNDIDSDLTWFPVTVFLTSSQGEEVFAEFDADEDFDRVAFTTSDGETQLYADCELFDDSESKAIYHVSKTGWTISSTADTDFYMYYDNDAGHNTSYVSKSGGTAGESVWDSNFKAVYHMQDNTTSTIVDSTSNDNDGTKKAANEPIEATGKVGQGQSFDGSNDYIKVADDNSLDITSAITVESIVKTDSGWADYDPVFYKYTSSGDVPYKLDIKSSHWRGYVQFTDSAYAFAEGTSTINAGTLYHICYTYDGTNGRIYVDGSVEATSADVSKTIKTTTEPLYFGGRAGGTVWFDGIIDETRISSTARSAAWIKATYNSLWDTLLTYGNKEIIVKDNAIFFGTNF